MGGPTLPGEVSEQQPEKEEQPTAKEDGPLFAAATALAQLVETLGGKTMMDASLVATERSVGVLGVTSSKSTGGKKRLTLGR